MTQSSLDLIGGFIRKRITTDESGTHVIHREGRSTLVGEIASPIPAPQDDVVTCNHVAESFCGSGTPSTGLTPNGGATQTRP